jgi:hypothetical protein
MLNPKRSEKCEKVAKNKTDQNMWKSEDFSNSLNAWQKISVKKFSVCIFWIFSMYFKKHKILLFYRQVQKNKYKTFLAENREYFYL